MSKRNIALFEMLGRKPNPKLSDTLESQSIGIPFCLDCGRLVRETPLRPHKCPGGSVPDKEFRVRF